MFSDSPGFEKKKTKRKVCTMLLVKEKHVNLRCTYEQIKHVKENLVVCTGLKSERFKSSAYIIHPIDKYNLSLENVNKHIQVTI